MAICPNCNAELPEGAAFCGNCGTPLPAASAGFDATGFNAGGNQPANMQSQAIAPAPAPYTGQTGQAYNNGDDAYWQSGQQAGYQGAPQQQAGYQGGAVAMPRATDRAFAMTLYVSNLLGIIFALAVRDKDNAFITHHLNNCVVILIGALIGGILSAFVIGIFLLIYLFVMAIMGMVRACHGEMKDLPLIGKIHIVK